MMSLILVYCSRLATLQEDDLLILLFILDVENFHLRCQHQNVLLQQPDSRNCFLEEVKQLFNVVDLLSYWSLLRRCFISIHVHQKVRCF